MGTQEEPISEKELAKLLKTVLTKRNLASIEGMVQDKDIVEAKIRVIEQSDVWKEHAKTHRDAKLQPLQVNKDSPQTIRESLGLDDIDYQLNEKEIVPMEDNLPTAIYGQSHSTGDHGYLAATSNPENKEFWMGCTCGMTIKAEQEDKGIQISTYDVATTTYATSDNTSTYGASAGAEYK